MNSLLQVVFNHCQNSLCTFHRKIQLYLLRVLVEMQLEMLSRKDICHDPVKSANQSLQIPPILTKTSKWLKRYAL
eukprot:m.824864 g.824864  ORF g.824864 m.824864 type:complete len:75 (-) comp23406_c0_seq23:6375-6599(-)